MSLIEERDWDGMRERMKSQREARLAKQEKDRKIAIASALESGSAGDFWDLVDSSDGADACHLWTGHINTTWASYPIGEFILDGCQTTLAHRITCFLTYGHEVDREDDVVQGCGNRLCCNINHFTIGKRGDRISAHEYFCSAAA